MPGILGYRVSVRHKASHSRAEQDERGEREGRADAVSDEAGDSCPRARFRGAEQNPGTESAGDECCGGKPGACRVARHDVVLYGYALTADIPDSKREEYACGHNGEPLVTRQPLVQPLVTRYPFHPPQCKCHRAHEAAHKKGYPNIWGSLCDLL